MYISSIDAPSIYHLWWCSEVVLPAMTSPEVITCGCTTGYDITGSCITGYDVTGSYIPENDVTGSRETETGNEREIISRVFTRFS